jgi:hypothetical protein
MMQDFRFCDAIVSFIGITIACMRKIACTPGASRQRSQQTKGGFWPQS